MTAAVLALSAGCQTVPREPFEASVQRLVSTGSLQATVDRLAQPLIDRHRNIGMVIAVSTPEDEGLFAYGSQDLEGRVPMTTDALFQTGSVSKSFAALVAAQLDHEGRIDIDAPISRLVPRERRAALRRFGDITPSELASHTAGLPHESYDLDTLWGLITYLTTGRNLYRYSSQATVDDFMRRTSYAKPTKHEYAYSNVGIAFLGWLVGQVDDKGYERTLRDEVLQPLGLAHTGLSLSRDGGRGLTPGYAGDLPTFVARHRPVEPWLFDEAVAAAGGVQSTAADLLEYAKANMGAKPTSLYPAMLATQIPRAPAEGGYIAMGWFLKTLADTRQPYTYIAGIIGGHTSFVGFDSKRKIAVVVLQNSINHDDMIAEMLLDRLIGAAMVAHEGRKVDGLRRVAAAAPADPMRFDR
jgi:CubicO group peptidase (beta-lactamase class C family)